MRRWVVAVVACVACTKEPAATPPVVPPPSAASEAAPVVRVHLEAGGAVLLNGAPVKLEELSERLRAIRAQKPEVEVHIDAAEGVPYPKVIDAIDAAQKAGIMGVSLDSAPQKAGEAPRGKP